MSKTNLLHRSSEISHAWRSVVVGRAANANVKVLRMDGTSYPSETHAFSEGLLVLEGQMNLEIGGEVVPVHQGEIFMVPAGVPHAVAAGSHGTLVIIDSLLRNESESGAFRPPRPQGRSGIQGLQHGA